MYKYSYTTKILNFDKVKVSYPNTILPIWIRNTEPLRLRFPSKSLLNLPQIKNLVTLTKATNKLNVNSNKFIKYIKSYRNAHDA